MTTDTPSASPVRASGNNADAPTSVAAPREHFASRLGFILISAGCAIGLGNVWRFPYIAGEYGGAAFILMYLIFLVILGLPVMVMEFAVGRASQRSAAQAFDILQPSRRWHWFSWWAYIGCMLLMMFYTTVCGWMLAYIVKLGVGEFNGLDAAGIGEQFNVFLADPVQQVGWMLVACLLGFLVVSLGLQKGVERITKVMMVCLLGILVVLVFRAVTLPGAEEGLRFYLVPDFGHLFAGDTPAEQWANFGDAAYAAWDEAARMEHRDAQNITLRFTLDMAEYFRLLMQDKDLAAVITTQGDATEADPSAPRAVFRQWGLDTLPLEQSGMQGLYVVDGGKVVYQKTGAGPLEYTLSWGGHDVTLRSAVDNSSIAVDGEEQSRNRPGVNVLVYDKVLDRVIQSISFSTLHAYSGYTA